MDNITHLSFSSTHFRTNDPLDSIFSFLHLYSPCLCIHMCLSLTQYLMKSGLTKRYTIVVHITDVNHTTCLQCDGGCMSRAQNGHDSGRKSLFFNTIFISPCCCALNALKKSIISKSCFLFSYLYFLFQQIPTCTTEYSKA